MLKIKDNVNLKELEKFGFELSPDKTCYGVFFNYYSPRDSKECEQNYVFVDIKSRIISHYIYNNLARYRHSCC